MFVPTTGLGIVGRVPVDQEPVAQDFRHNAWSAAQRPCIHHIYDGLQAQFTRFSVVIEWVCTGLQGVLYSSPVEIGYPKDLFPVKQCTWRQRISFNFEWLIRLN